jgi:hypothetical protein
MEKVQDQEQRWGEEVDPDDLVDEKIDSFQLNEITIK